MANNYSNTTGVLVLNNVTNVIFALFGPFNLDESMPDDGEVYIANIAEDSDTTWEAVRENLEALIDEVGLEISSDEEHSLKDLFRILASHYGADKDAGFMDWIERIDFNPDDDADLGDLFELARKFDDGHGLRAIKTETSWHSDKPRLGDFGGCGEFVGEHFVINESSEQVAPFGDALDKAVAGGNTNSAAYIVLKRMDQILSGIKNETEKNAIRRRLGELLASHQD